MSWDILPKSNLQYFLQKLKGKFDGKVDIVAGKGLSTNDYTTTEKNKLAGIESGAQVNPTIDSELSSTSTNAVQNKVVKSALDGKADNSDVTETDTPNSTPFLYRKTPYEADRVFLDELVGADIVVNQLVQNGDFANGTTSWQLSDATASVSGGVCSVTPTASGINLRQLCVRNKITHKILVSVFVKSTSSDIRVAMQNAAYRFSVFASGSGNWEHITGIYTSVEAEEVLCFHSDGTAFQVKDCNIIDLTQLFGSDTIPDYIYSLEQATAGSGIDWLKSYGFFTKDYYPYNAGELISVKTSGKKYVGFNQWDEEYLLGHYNRYGVFEPQADTIASKNPIQVFPNTTYYLKSGTYHPLYILFYDENMTFIRYTSLNNDGTFLTPNNARYVNFNNDFTGSVYNNDICINISKTEGTPKNGDYVPYEEHAYDISNIDLRGIPKLVNNELVYDGDIYDSDGNVTRKYGIVDFGNANYEYVSVLAQDGIFPIVISDRKSNVNVISAFNIDVAANWDDIPNKSIRVVNYEQNMRVRFDGCTTVDQIKAAMSGVYLVYELATPTTETTDPFTNPQICDKDGTEEFIDNRDFPVPVGHNSTYANLPSIMDGDFLNYMAKNFASEEYVDRALEEIDTELNTKVDKVAGKGLSTNDYTNEEKALVATIPNKADADDVKGTQTATGNPITITDASETYAQSLVVELSPKQDLHGYDFPWVWGAGKNKLPVNESTITGTGWIFETPVNLPVGTWTFSFKSAVTTNLSLGIFNEGGNNIASVGINNPTRSVTFTLNEVGKTAKLYGYVGTYYDMQIESGNQATTFAPWENICPISGYEGVEVTTADSDTDPTQSRTASVTFGQTVYGGSVDFTEGGTDDDRASVDLGSLTWTKDGNDFLSSELSVLMRRPSSVSEAANMLCECFDVKAQSNFETKNGSIAYFYTNSSESVSKVVVYLTDTSLQDFMTIVNGQKLVYEKATPTTIPTPPTELKLLQDTNNLTTNGTTITIDYIPNNSIGDAVKASEEYTDRVVERKADNTTTSVELPGVYDTSTKNFPTKNAVSGSVQNCLTYINDLADKLYTAINSHATALANIPTKTVVVDHRAIDVGDEFNVLLPLSYKFLIVELYIYANGECGSIVSTDFANGSVLSIVANGHGSSYWCDLSRMANRITVDGNFDSTHGELTITAF